MTSTRRQLFVDCSSPSQKKPAFVWVPWLRFPGLFLSTKNATVLGDIFSFCSFGRRGMREGGREREREKERTRGSGGQADVQRERIYKKVGSSTCRLIISGRNENIAFLPVSDKAILAWVFLVGKQNETQITHFVFWTIFSDLKTIIAT